MGEPCPRTSSADALTRAREAFIATHVDRQRIHDISDSEPLAMMFTADIRQSIRDTPGYRTRIAPGFRLLDVPPKVSGSMSVEPGKKGELNIRANYSVAYAFHIDDPRQIQDAMDIVSVFRVDKRYVMRAGNTFAATSRGLWPGEGSTGATYSLACTPAKEGLLAPGYSERRYGTLSNEPARAQIFDPSRRCRPRARVEKCHQSGP